MKKKILSVLLLIMSVFMLASCKKRVIVDEKDRVSIHTELQEAYLNDEYKNFSKYATGVENLSTPKAVEITFDETIIPLSNNYTVYLSTSDKFKTYKTYETTTTSLAIYNLFINTTYFYKINNGTTESSVLSFTTTAKGPRNINADGLTNVRDMGGWKIGDNKYINQGLIYRTSKFNADETTDLMITQEGINVLVNELGIKTEIDLRRTDNNETGGITTSPLGSSVRYISIPMKSSGNILTLNPDQIVEVFKVFANKDNYPICFHCSIGTDRTGLIAFLLNGLLGASEEDLYRDYLFSNFGNIGSMRTPSAINTYLKDVRLERKDPLNTNIYNYLIKLGLTKAELDNIVKIMTK